MDRYCDTDLIVFAAHFPAPSIGHIVPRGGAFWFAYNDETIYNSQTHVFSHARLLGMSSQVGTAWELLWGKR